MYKLFTGLSLPDDVANALSAISTGIPGAAWRPIENFHITLRYYGDVSHETALALDEELAAIALPIPSVKIKSAGSYGGEEPHAIWVGIEANDALTTLSKRCDRAAHKVGLQRDNRPFKPHITLAYCKNVSVRDVMTFCHAHNEFNLPAFEARSFHLFSSWRSKGSNRYVSEAEYPLR